MYSEPVPTQVIITWIFLALWIYSLYKTNKSAKEVGQREGIRRAAYLAKDFVNDKAAFDKLIDRELHPEYYVMLDREARQLNQKDK